jgi:hypothetical protein
LGTARPELFSPDGNPEKCIKPINKSKKQEEHENK